MGGGAMILGLPGEIDQEVPSTIGKGTLSFIHVVSRWHLSFDRIEDDARLPGYGEPVMWRMNSGRQQNIHPSRVIPFRADTASLLAVQGTADAFWGESTVQQVIDAVKDSDTARASFAAMLHKARLTRIGIPDLIAMTADDKGAKQFHARLAAVALGESLHNITAYDAGSREGDSNSEKIDDVDYTFAGAKDILNAFNEAVCAVSDIPATRLLGRAPEGMNSSGDSQQKDWNKKIRSRQTLELGPCMDRLDPLLVSSAIGRPVPTAANDWAPLDTPSEKENAERFKTQMEASEKLRDLNAMPEQAFNRGLQSLMIEEGYLPELEHALSEIDEAERYGLVSELEGGGLDLLPGGELEPPGRAANDKAGNAQEISPDAP